MPANIPGVAVIGLAGRFPGGGGIDEFWADLVRGHESLTSFSNDDEQEPPVVAGIVPDGDMFDAGFFGYSPSEAMLIDPQHRVFLECAWEALENAGYDPQRYPGAIGVYGGCGDTGYLEQLRTHSASMPEVSELQLRLATSADFLTSRVAYKLGLTGPAMTVQTACATSLVAVHAGVQALLSGECDMALAGGITLHVPFPHDDASEGGITATDGHCRAFDVRASGTIASDGAGIVVLKRLEEAEADGDSIYTVILGSAVTNDGMAKVGFTAPGVDGIAAAVHGAQVLADVDPASIDYVEAHGTGTAVGDPIEVRGLTKAFGLDEDQAGTVLLGAVKSNIGHTDVAAGVHGLMKVALSMRHRMVPGTLHFTTPNPALDLSDTPFRVTSRSVPWPLSRTRQRRAGVSAMGLGGTNVHVVMEEAPPLPAVGREPPGDLHLLPLSARSPAALTAAASALAEHLGRHTHVPLADVGWTLQAGRRQFAWRGFVVAASTAEAKRALTGATPSLVTSSVPVLSEADGAVFMFPGQGGQHVGMAGDLYRRYPSFRADIDNCADLAADFLGLDFRAVLFPDSDDRAATRIAERRIRELTIGQPAVFAVEYALARLWQSWGVRPVAVLGHSLGAYAAATIAGVLSLPDAMTLVLERGRLLSGMPTGAMLALPMPAQDVEGRLGPDLSMAVINGPAQCVVAGRASAITALRSSLAAEGIEGRVLHISAAAHSHLIEPLLPAFEKVVVSATLHKPAIDWISDLTGLPVTTDEATSPSYWTAHLRHTVNFSAALSTVLGNGTAPWSGQALLEIGPGRTLGNLARQHPACPDGRVIVSSMRHAADDRLDQAVLLTAAGRLWQAGVPVDWAATHGGSRRRRVPLPTYPFERGRFRIGRPLPTGRKEKAGSAGHAEAEGDAEAAWSTPTQAVVADAYQAILGIDQLEGDRDFFDLGGDSLLAARVAAILRRELNLTVGVGSILSAPTVKSLAALLDEGQVSRS